MMLMVVMIISVTGVFGDPEIGSMWQLYWGGGYVLNPNGCLGVKKMIGHRKAEDMKYAVLSNGDEFQIVGRNEDNDIDVVMRRCGVAPYEKYESISEHPDGSRPKCTHILSREILTQTIAKCNKVSAWTIIHLIRKPNGGTYYSRYSPSHKNRRASYSKPRRGRDLEMGRRSKGIPGRQRPKSQNAPGKKSSQKIFNVKTGRNSHVPARAQMRTRGTVTEPSTGGPTAFDKRSAPVHRRKITLEDLETRKIEDNDFEIKFRRRLASATNEQRRIFYERALRRRRRL